MQERVDPCSLYLTWTTISETSCLFEIRFSLEGISCSFDPFIHFITGLRLPLNSTEHHIHKESFSFKTEVGESVKFVSHSGAESAGNIYIFQNIQLTDTLISAIVCLICVPASIIAKIKNIKSHHTLSTGSRTCTMLQCTILHVFNHRFNTYMCI